MPKASQPTAPKRSQQLYSGGLGKAFTSPLKKRDPRKTKVYAKPLGYEARNTELFKLLEQVTPSIKATSPSQPDTPVEPEVVTTVVEIETDDDEAPEGPIPEEANVQADSPKKKKLSGHDKGKVYERWSWKMDSLLPPFLDYISRTMSQKLERPGDLRAECHENAELKACPRKSHKVLCLFHDCFEELLVDTCECEDVCYVLVKNGIFPCSPSQPHMAIAISLLDFYQALFERSCDAVNAFAAACHTYYLRRGFILRNHKGEAIQDAFRRSISQAIQWYDSLQVQINHTINAALKLSDQMVQAQGSPNKDPESHADLTECAWVLQQRCPACFGGANFGLPFDEGGDIHVSVDGNFNHRHLQMAGDCPPFHNPEYYLPKDYVDEVPDEAVDECEDRHIAGTGTKVKTSMEKYDDTGNMALVCRHDIPIFLANIDTPGEQQKYAVALIKKLFSLLPPNAMVAVFYDIGCVLDRSMEMYDILPDDITSHITFAMSAMHAYAHQWACQLVYNPRIRKSLGLTDGEGMERIWSRLRKVIGITRVSAREQRIWLIDRLTASIGADMRNDLGDWIRWKLKTAHKYREEAMKQLVACGILTAELRLHWKEQQEAQLSICAHRPQRLKKELDSVLLLQADLDRINERIEATTASLSVAPLCKKTEELLASLQASHDALKDKVEGTYGALNVEQSFPELKGLDYEFVRVLLLLRDLKINIRKRAIASFFEWDKLDQAAAGREQALGTSTHQLTCKAISKRQPALTAAIKRFNTLCALLAQLYKAEWKLPLPKPLPTKLHALRDASDLLEDVWIEPAPLKTPKWLESLEVREGIRAMLKVDRCQEELKLLGLEADNLCRWYGRELANVELALTHRDNAQIFFKLAAYRNHLLLLKTRWATPLASLLRFESHVKQAKSIVSKVWGHPVVQLLTWISPRIHAFDLSGMADMLPVTETATIPSVGHSLC